MNEKYLQELINNYKDVRKDFWNSFILLIAGMIGIIFSIKKFDFSIFTFVKVIFFTTGVFAAHQLFLVIASFNKEILDLVNKLKRSE